MPNIFEIHGPARNSFVHSIQDFLYETKSYVIQETFLFLPAFHGSLQKVC